MRKFWTVITARISTLARRAQASRPDRRQSIGERGRASHGPFFHPDSCAPTLLRITSVSFRSAVSKCSTDPPMSPPWDGLAETYELSSHGVTEVGRFLTVHLCRAILRERRGPTRALLGPAALGANEQSSAPSLTTVSLASDPDSTEVDDGGCMEDYGATRSCLEIWVGGGRQPHYCKGCRK